ncbi:hypothetical protein FQR65_LT20780 [Abscondita terminalis]|nr:hypothetical protein FQR65_LT20780 [Abscondita terminalis]
MNDFSREILDFELTSELTALTETSVSSTNRERAFGLNDYFTALFQHHASGGLKEREAVRVSDVDPRALGQVATWHHYVKNPQI